MDRINELIQRATADLEEAEAQLRAAEGRVRELTMIRDGLRFALQRYGNADAERPVTALTSTSITGAARSWTPPDGSQSDHVLGVVTVVGRPAKSREVYEKLLAEGHEYEFDQVRSALAYLQRKGKIKRVGTALWEAPRAMEPTSEESFAPAEETAGASRAGENGAANQVGVLTGTARPHGQ